MLLYQTDFTILNRGNYREIWLLDDAKYSLGAIFALDNVLLYGHPLVLIDNLRG